MSNCFKCGISDEKALLFDGVSDKGIVKICRKCLIIENLPVIRTKTEEEVQKQMTRKPASFSEKQRQYIPTPSNDDLALRKLVEKNFKETVQEDFSLKSTLIDNFNWTLMRTRRAKHLTIEQLAKAIKEPEIAIRTLEMGHVPQKSRELISKLENYLFIKLRRLDRSSEAKKNPSDFNSMKDWKVADFKEIAKSEPPVFREEDF